MDLNLRPQSVRPAQRTNFSTQKKVKTEIMLGNPSTSCNGVGICHVLAYGQQSEKNCPRVTTWISVTEEGKIRFSFLKAGMDKSYIRKHFGWRLFQVYTAYELSEKVAHKLGLKEVKVLPGIYTVWETPKHLVIDF